MRARTSSTTFSGVRSTQGATRRSVSGSLDASTSRRRECCARSTTSAGATNGTDLDARVDLGARASALTTGAALAATATPAGASCPRRPCRRRPCRCAAATATAATTVRTSPTGLARRFARTHGRQANGCRSITPVRSGCVPDPPGEDPHGAARRGRRARPHRHRFTAARAAAAARRPLLPHGRDVRPPRRHPGVARRGQRHVSPTGTRSCSDYVATVDWPACTFWRELADANPDADRAALDPVERRRVVEERERHDLPGLEARDPRRTRRRCSRAQMAMANDMFANTFTPDWQDETAAKRAYEEHNAAVRADVDPAAPRRVATGRRVGAALHRARRLPVPDDPFPHVNSTADFRAMIGLDDTHVTTIANCALRRVVGSDGAEERDRGLLRALAERVVAQERLDQRGIDAARHAEHVHADVVGVDDRDADTECARQLRARRPRDPPDPSWRGRRTAGWCRWSGRRWRGPRDRRPGRTRPSRRTAS